MKKFFMVILPLVLPFLLYALYVTMARRRARLAGEGNLPRWQDAPWHWIVAASVLLLVASLIVYRDMTVFEAGTVLEPTRLERPESPPGLPVQ